MKNEREENAFIKVLITKEQVDILRIYFNKPEAEDWEIGELVDKAIDNLYMEMLDNSLMSKKV